jgi:hypothetical protein
MAAPVGHIFCALALFNSGHEVLDKNAFLAGTSFPDIRYVSSLNRKETHKLSSTKLASVLDATPFEAGRRFHAWVDLEREKYMKAMNAYEFFKDMPYKSHMLKFTEDRILWDKEKLKINSHEIFGKIYEEEKDYLSESQIKIWHGILATYLDTGHNFYFTRYLSTWMELRKLEKPLIKDWWSKIKFFGLALYAYVKIIRLSKDPKLKAIVLGFYEDKISKLFGSKFVPN